MERCLDFAPFAVARFCVPLSFAEPSLCCNVAIALSAARRPRCEQGAVPSIYSSARTELAKLLIYGLFRKIRVLAQDEVRPFHSWTRWVPAETDLAGAAAPLPGVPFTMAARMRRVVAECPPWVRCWRSCKRTRRRKTRESELGGAAPKVCSQTRRKLAKSKPSKTTFRPTPVSCGITERSLLCSIKSSLMRDFRVRSSTARSSPRSPRVGGFQGRLSC